MEGAWVPVEGGLDCDAGSLHVLWRSVSTVYKAAKHNGITCRTPADPGASAGTKLVLSQYNKYIGLRTSTSELDSEGTHCETSQTTEDDSNLVRGCLI
jgi:hypothetical protein